MILKLLPIPPLPRPFFDPFAPDASASRPDVKHNTQLRNWNKTYIIREKFKRRYIYTKYEQESKYQKH